MAELADIRPVDTAAPPLSALWALLAMVALLGFAQISITPAWEGFDEPVHWSYTQQIADEGRAPVFGRDQASHDLDLYPGPWTRSMGRGDRDGYRAFQRSGRASLGSAGPTRFSQGSVPNWQAQHPPLFYVLTAPVYHLAHNLPWKAHLWVLRAVCWLLAFTGFAWGVLTVWQRLPGERHATLAMACWPVLIPEFFPEFARFGNDSLCLLLFAALWSILVSMHLDPLPRRLARAAVLGGVLGLGLLTKAFFVPIGAGVAAWLVASPLLAGRRVALAPIALTLLTAILVGGGWYAWKWATTGALLGEAEAIELARQGGMAVGLGRHLTLQGVANGVASIGATFIWAGTWSLVRPPAWSLLPVIALVALTLGRWLTGLARRGEPALSLLPLLVVTPMALGLIHHVFQRIASGQVNGGTPGWYLHILSPALAYVFARHFRWDRATSVLTVAAIAVLPLEIGTELAVFSGCVERGADGVADYAHAACTVDGRVLGALAFPWTAALFALVALGCAGWAWISLRRARTQEQEMEIGLAGPAQRVGTGFSPR